MIVKVINKNQVNDSSLLVKEDIGKTYVRISTNKIQFVTALEGSEYSLEPSKSKYRSRSPS